MKNYLTIFFFFFISISYGQRINNNWKQDLNNELEQFKVCDNTTTTGINPCNWFIGNTLTTVYKINDFYSKELGRHMLVSEISEFLKESKQWTLLGLGYDQKVLKEAQNYANSGKAVVAIYLNKEEIGHLSVILPGELKPSGTWGFNVPNSSSFFTSDPEKSYVDKGLAYAFGRSQIMKVLIYVRNY